MNGAAEGVCAPLNNNIADTSLGRQNWRDISSLDLILYYSEIYQINCVYGRFDAMAQFNQDNDWEILTWFDISGDYDCEAIQMFSIFPAPLTKNYLLPPPSSSIDESNIAGVKICADFFCNQLRSAGEVSALRPVVIQHYDELHSRDEDPECYAFKFLDKVAPRSALTDEERFQRDMVVGMDWCLLTQIQRLGDEFQQLETLPAAPDEKFERRKAAFERAARQLDLALTYAILDVYGHSLHAVGLSTRAPGDVHLPDEIVDVTPILRTQLMELIEFAHNQRPEDERPTSKDFELLNLWREGGGREAVFAEYPFWLKHED